MTSSELTLCLYTWACVHADVTNKAAGQGADTFVLLPISAFINRLIFPWLAFVLSVLFYRVLVFLFLPSPGDYCLKMYELP